MTEVEKALFAQAESHAVETVGDKRLTEYGAALVFLFTKNAYLKGAQAGAAWQREQGAKLREAVRFHLSQYGDPTGQLRDLCGAYDKQDTPILGKPATSPNIRTGSYYCLNPKCSWADVNTSFDKCPECRGELESVDANQAATEPRECGPCWYMSRQAGKPVKCAVHEHEDSAG